jgi:hypothetical protein
LAKAARSKRRSFREDTAVLVATMLILFSFYLFDITNGPSEFYKNSADVPGQEDLSDLTEPELVLVEDTLVQRTGYTDEGSSTHVDIEMPWTDMVEIRAVLQWTDDLGSNDELGLSIELEGRELTTSSSTSGNIDLTSLETPNGNYTMTIRALSCPGQVDPAPVDRDTGNEWSLEVTVIREVEM